MSLNPDETDIRMGGLYRYVNDGHNALTVSDWISFKDRKLPSKGLLAHERYHMEEQVMVRGFMNMALEILLGRGIHTETTPHGINNPSGK